MRLKILHKGIAFLLVPLLVQFLFFYQMLNLTKQSEQLAGQEERITNKISFLNHLTTDLIDGYMVISGYLFNPGPDAKKLLSDYANRSREIAANFRRTFPGNSASTQIADSLQKMVDDEYAEITELMAAKESVDDNSIMRVRSSVKRVRSMVQRMGTQYHAIMTELDNERADLEATRQQARRNREQIDNQVFVFMVLDVVLALTLLIVFLQDITNRLSVLVRNAEAIPTGQTMIRRVSGNDELAYLDKVMHDAADKLKVAAEYRNTLMTMLAHDLRSPLSAAQMTLKSLLSQATGREKQEENRIKAASQNIHRTISLVEDLLTIDKLDAGKLDLQRELVDAKRLVDESLEALEPLSAAKKITLKNTVEPNVVIDADRWRIAQVMQNLLTNAIKHSPPMGTIAVAAEQKPDSVTISISDEGTGVTDDSAAKLFDKFYQADSTQGGFGLGLAITKMIVTAHGGSCGALAREGGGSTFWFSLPAERLPDGD
ncbi:MAG TPA: HAMP domain-containing sensor histidine kinase [Trichormus sp.]|jgi:signal transduction histidine kinase